MDTITLKAFLTLLMCSDPWPVNNDQDNQITLERFADSESRRHGFTDWIEAYHKIK